MLLGETLVGIGNIILTGITVQKTLDTLIATRCIADDRSLLYADRDFEPFAVHLGLRSAG